MKVAIVGSRAYTRERDVEDFILMLPSDTVIVSGAQPKGVDGFAYKFAKKHRYSLVEFPPTHYAETPHAAHTCPLTGKELSYGGVYYVSNYFERNSRIAKYSDVVAAFTTTKESRGTMDTVHKAEKYGKPVIHFNGYYDPQEAWYWIEDITETIR